MKVHRRIKITILVAMTAHLVSAVTLNGAFDPKAKRFRKVCVLPADATLVKLGMKGAEGMTAESDVWAAKLNQTMARAPH